MRTRTHSGLVMSGVLIGCLMAAEGTRLVAQEGESRAPNSEISIGGAKVTETYERVTNAPRLIVTTKMDMRGHEVSVRRVYDTGNAR